MWYINTAKEGFSTFKIPSWQHTGYWYIIYKCLSGYIIIFYVLLYYNIHQMILNLLGTYSNKNMLN